MRTTFVYLIRHGESPLTEGDERTRGLTEIGARDARRIAVLLEAEDIGRIISSPYRRAVLTLQPLAQQAGLEVEAIEDLRERAFWSKETRMPNAQLRPLLEKSFADSDFALPGAESNAACQLRAVAALKELLAACKGQRLAVGTHGAVMTLMLGYYDRRYGLDFLLHRISKPDIYRMEFDGTNYVGTRRLWDGG